MINLNDKNKMDLLAGFNSRANNAFESLYMNYCKGLNIFAASIYGGLSPQSEDAVIDAFVNLWESNNRFESLIAIKSYLYVSIKNGYIRQRERNEYMKKYLGTFSNKDFEVNIIESEIYSVIDEAINILPKRYAAVIKKYVEGYKPSEIAKILDEKESNVYKIKNKALNILKKKLPPGKLLILTSLLS